MNAFVWMGSCRVVLLSLLVATWLTAVDDMAWAKQTITEDTSATTTTPIPPGPSVSLTQAPSNPTSSSTAVFAFTASSPAGISSSWCRLDNLGDWQNCTNGTVTFSNLAAGSHFFWVGTYDTNNANTGVGYTWTITPAGISLTKAPSDPTSSSTAVFAFKASSPAGISSSWCRLDNVGDWQNCTNGTITFSNLAVGSHFFWVGTYDNNNASTGVGYTWTINPASVSLTKAPSNPTSSSTAVFAFKASSPAGISSSWCRLDNVGDWQNCTNGTITFSNLAAGSHSFWVGTYDNNNANTGVGYTWTIDPPPSPSSSPSFPSSSPDPSGSTVTEVYSGPPGNDSYRSNLYTVEVFDGSMWRSSYTYKYSRRSVMAWHQGASPSVNFTTFGTTEPVNVRITNVGGALNSVDISPKSKNIQAAIDNSQASFTLNQNDKVWITLNGDDANPLFIFADAPKPSIPAGATVFGPGVQTVNHYKAVSNQVIYLDGGAWVRGNIDITGTKNVQIMGPGVLSGDVWLAENVQSLPFSQFAAYAMIRGDWGGNGARVQGITIVASPGYNFYSGASSVYGVKLLSPWFYSTDGFQGVPKVDQSFAFVGDNTFFPSSAGVQKANVAITNSFAGTTGNAVFCGGFWGNAASNTYTSLVDNIDIKTYGNPPSWGVPTPNIFQIWVNNANSTKGYSNQTYQNIRIEGNLSAPMAQLKNMTYPWGGANAYNPAFGNSSNLVFKNISLSGTQPARSEIKGIDVNNGFHNVTFDNLTMGGTVVTPANASDYFDVNSYVSGLNFTGQ